MSDGRRWKKDDDGKIRGSYPSGGNSGLTNNGESGTIPIRDCAKIKQLSEIDDNAAHKLVKGFEEPELTEHWEGSSRANSHKGQYEGMTKEEYGKRARELAESPTGKYIRGFACLNQNIIVRYDVRTGDFVKAHIHNGVITMFKPKTKAVYFNNQYKAEMRDRPHKKKRK